MVGERQLRRLKALERQRLRHLLGQKNAAEHPASSDFASHDTRAQDDVDLDEPNRNCYEEKASLTESLRESPIAKRFAASLQENIPTNTCLNLSKEHKLQEKIDILIELVKSQQAQKEAHIKLLSDQIADQTVLIRQLVTDKIQSEDFSQIFPLKNEGDLLKLEEAIGPESRKIYVTAMKKILGPIGIKKGLPRLLSDTIVGQYNIHGVKNKKGLKALPKFYQALLDSIPESNSGDLEEELRLALVAEKKNHFKRLSLKRKAEQNEHTK